MTPTNTPPTPSTTARRARAPRLDRDTALRLARVHHQRLVTLLRSLDPEDWSRPTECPGWDVRAMAGHALGMAEMVATVPELLRQTWLSARAGGGIDALTALQVREHADLSPAELVRRLDAVGDPAVRGRRRMPAAVRRLPLPEQQVVSGARERWQVGFLTDVVLTRDPWMHRMDIARATDRSSEWREELTADDAVLVADVVAEWADRHRQPYLLRLTGPAGGTFSAGTAGTALDLDAVEFCRTVSGRVTGTGLLAQQVPF